MENPKKELESWELAKNAVNCPNPYAARLILHLTVQQFCKLLEISEITYWKWLTGEESPTISQKIFIKEAIRIAKEKKLI